jgi:hypothetical protein
MINNDYPVSSTKNKIMIVQADQIRVVHFVPTTFLHKLCFSFWGEGEGVAHLPKHDKRARQHEELDDSSDSKS